MKIPFLDRPKRPKGRDPVDMSPQPIGGATDTLTQRFLASASGSVRPAPQPGQPTAWRRR